MANVNELPGRCVPSAPPVAPRRDYAIDLLQFDRLVEIRADHLSARNCLNCIHDLPPSVDNDSPSVSPCVRRLTLLAVVWADVRNGSGTQARAADRGG